MLAKICIAMVRGYQLTLSSWVGWQCRFVPTCSNYSIEAFRRFGFIRGLWMTVTRIIRCNPFGGSGYDPVPETFRWRCWRHDDQEK